MSDLDLNSKQWCELVFDGKNTEFGAFQMRQESTSRHNKAMIIVAILVVLIITLPALFRYIAPKKQEEVKMTEVTQLTKLPPPEVKNNDAIKKVDAPPPPPLKSSIKFTAPKIVKDEDADREDVKTQEEIISAKVAVSVADVKGNDDLFGTDIQDLKEIAIDTPQEEVQETVFQTVEQMPSFPGGMQALNKYLKDNLRYPTIAAENGVSGRVVLRFVVSKSGKIETVDVLGPVDRALDEEAVRVVKSMPAWVPGKQNGNAVAVYYTLPVTFVLGQQ